MVFKRIIAALTLLCFLICLQGCYYKHMIPVQALEEHPDYRIADVVTVDGEFIEFDIVREKGAVIVDGKIEGLTTDGSFKSISISQVKTVRVKKTHTGRIAVISCFAVLVFLLVVLMTWEGPEISIGD
jgi:hypothetical protein